MISRVLAQSGSSGRLLSLVEDLGDSSPGWICSLLITTGRREGMSSLVANAKTL